MDNKKETLEEQNAPLKNTDNAFVQVSEDGSPHMPTKEEETENKEGKRAPDTSDR